MFLSTFAGTQQPSVAHSSGVAIVRRNKKGKQAPAPPKRTSSFRDSQCDLDPDDQSYALEDAAAEAEYYKRRENASFDKLADLTDADYADLSGADEDDDSECSDTAQSVPDIRSLKEARDRGGGLRTKGSKSRTYPIKDHLGATRFGPISGSSHSKTQVSHGFFTFSKNSTLAKPRILASSLLHSISGLEVMITELRIQNPEFAQIFNISLTHERKCIDMP